MGEFRMSSSAAVKRTANRRPAMLPPTGPQLTAGLVDGERLDAGIARGPVRGRMLAAALQIAHLGTSSSRARCRWRG